MSNIGKAEKAQRDVEVLQSALAAVHSGLDMVETMVETARRSAEEVRRGVRVTAKVGLGDAPTMASPVDDVSSGGCH